PVVVVGLGKLGGRELITGSDLDLFVVTGDEGRTDGGDPIDAAWFYSLAVERLAGTLGDITAAGVAFPVDLRLRPGSKGSGFASSVAALERYYAEYGDLWERQTLTRARLVLGGPRLPPRVRAALRGAGYGTPRPPCACWARGRATRSSWPAPCRRASRRRSAFRRARRSSTPTASGGTSSGRRISRPCRAGARGPAARALTRKRARAEGRLTSLLRRVWCLYGAPHFDDDSAWGRGCAGVEESPSGGPLGVRPHSEGPPGGSVALLLRPSPTLDAPFRLHGHQTRV